MLDEGVEITIGSARGCTLVLPDIDVLHQHLRVTLRGSVIVVEMLQPREYRVVAPRMWIDDVEVPAATPTTCDVDATIRIGSTLIQLEHGSVAPRSRIERMPEPLEQAELDLIAKLAADPSDDTTREVYADWLEANGFPLRAAFVRLELAGGADIERSEPLAKMVGASDAAWRCAVSRGEVHYCARPCDRHWHQLAPTAEPEVRRCDECGFKVVYAASRVDVREAGSAAVPVVYDAELPRARIDGLYRPRGDTDEDPPWE